MMVKNKPPLSSLRREDSVKAVVRVVPPCIFEHQAVVMKYMVHHVDRIARQGHRQRGRVRS